ncbi:MAG: sufB, partial [candidate division NC10 bacterium]|nr:sufB [candidate division NC10 bacterium]
MAPESDVKALEGLDRYKYGFSDPDEAVFKTRRGLNREVVEQISALKGEPAWMLESRLKALEHYRTRPTPTWGPELAQIDFDNIVYYVRPAESEGKTWEEVPET